MSWQPPNQRQPPQSKPWYVRGWDNFIHLRWYDGLIDLLFTFTARSSEILLAAGVVLATANHFQHGALFSEPVTDLQGGVLTHEDGSPILHDTLLFTIFSWTQAIGFEASSGVVLMMALEANRNLDHWKRNVLLALMGGLALVGTVMLIMGFVEGATGIKERDLPAAYGVTMAILRGVVSVAYVIVGRVKHLRFSGTEVLAPVSVPDVFIRLDQFGKSIEEIAANTERTLRQLEANTERRFRLIEANTEHRIGEITEIVRSLTEIVRSDISEQVSPLTEIVRSHADLLQRLPDLTEQLGQIEQSTRSHLRVVVEEVTHVKATLEQQQQELPRIAQQAVSSELGRIPEHFRLSAPKSTNTETKSVKSQSEPNIRKRTPNTETKSPNRTSESEPKPNTETKVGFEKGLFVRQCLSENPQVRNNDIQRKAEALGEYISASYISETRKAFFGEHDAGSLMLVSVSTDEAEDVA